MATSNTTAPLHFGGEHTEQHAFVQSRARYPAFISGIGAGKTVGGIGRLIANVSEWNPGHTGFVIAPTVPSLRNVIIPELGKWGVLDRCDYNRTDKRLTFPNGSTVILESADNDRKIQRLRGPSIAWFWMDEAATIDERAWDVMVGRLREGDYLNAFVTTTPKGKNWLHRKFIDPDTRLSEADVIRNVPTAENPHLPTAYTDSIVEEYDGQFYNQEVLGQFVQFEGLVYPWFDDDNLVAPVDPTEASWDEVVYGVDWGHNNPSTILACIRQGDGDGATWTVAEEWYETRRTVNDHSRALEDMQARWGPGVAICDPSEPANIDQFKRDGLAATPAENDVTPGIQCVSALRESLRVAENCQNLRNEFSQYQYKDDDSDKPEKVNDHALDALRYLLYTHTRRKLGNTGDGDFARSF